MTRRRWFFPGLLVVATPLLAGHAAAVAGAVRDGMVHSFDSDATTSQLKYRA
jgi:hypothetical protein